MRLKENASVPNKKKHSEAEIPEEKCQCSTRVKVWSAIGIVLGIVAVVLGTVLSKVLKPEDPKETPTPSPPQEIPQELESLLSSVSFDNGTALQTPSTPQNDALIWLANNTNLDSYSDARKIQRYVLATLYYSTNGAQWLDNTDWLTDLDECTWYNS